MLPVRLVLIPPRDQRIASMHEVSVSREIDAPKSAVWEVLDDFGGVSKYSPGVEDSGIVDGPDTGVGAVRECHLDEGGRIAEKIVEYDAGSSFTVEFVDMGSFPLKENIVEVAVREIDSNRSEVTMTSRFTPKFGPIGWLMAKVMMKSKLEESFGESLAGLEEYVKSETDHSDATAAQAAEA